MLIIQYFGLIETESRICVNIMNVFESATHPSTKCDKLSFGDGCCVYSQMARVQRKQCHTLQIWNMPKSTKTFRWFRVCVWMSNAPLLTWLRNFSTMPCDFFDFFLQRLAAAVLVSDLAVSATQRSARLTALPMMNCVSAVVVLISGRSCSNSCT